MTNQSTKIIDFLIFVILFLILVLPIYLFASLVHIKSSCLSNGVIKKFIDRGGNYNTYLLKDGRTWQVYHKHYQNGQEICLVNKSVFYIEWQPLFFSKKEQE
jgi:hypothetical protein